MNFYKLAVASFLLVFNPIASMAQQNPIGGLVGGLINAAKQGAAKEEWEKISPIKQTCFNAALRTNNLSVQSLIQNGIGPSDPRLNQANAACDEMINRKFRTDYECNFNIDNRSIVTWCDEAYAVPNGNGGARRLTVEEAINASASGQQLSMGQFEKPDAERRRLQMMQQNPTATNVPKPLWNCDKANKPTDKAICNSYDLTLIDNQYGQYWNMAKPLDKKKELQKKNDGFYKAGIACNGSEDCIKRNLIVAIDTIAAFLKDNGIQVKTYTEQEQIRQAALAEQKLLEEERQKRIAEEKQKEQQRQREAYLQRQAEQRARTEERKARIAAGKATAVVFVFCIDKYGAGHDKSMAETLIDVKSRSETHGFMNAVSQLREYCTMVANQASPSLLENAELVVSTGDADYFSSKAPNGNGTFGIMVR